MSLTEAQLEQRRSLLTASDAAAVLGLDPWRGPHDVWAEKMGMAPPRVQNWRMRRGHAVEPLLLEWLGEQSAPLEVRRAGDKTLTHPILTWLGATPDALLYEPGKKAAVAVGEAKSTGHRAAWVDEDGNPIVPDYYQCQVVVQMAVLRVPAARVAVEVIGEPEPWVLPFERSEDDEAAVLEGLERFWTDHIVAKVPPSLDGATYGQVARVYPWAKRPHMLATSPEIDAIAARYLKAKALAKKAEEAAEAAKTALCKVIGEDEGIQGLNWRATWRERAAAEVKYTRQAYRHFSLTTKKGT